MNEYLKYRQAHINADRPIAPKKQYTIPKKSARRKAKEDALAASGGDDAMDQFFEAMRKRLIGTCQCGCCQPSQKNDDTFYRGSIAHIFPKRIFTSISTHELNWVERAMFGGCHAKMDDSGLEKWPMMADWDDIKERFHILAPLLTDQERAHKFYGLLEKLVYS